MEAAYPGVILPEACEDRLENHENEEKSTEPDQPLLSPGDQSDDQQKQRADLKKEAKRPMWVECGVVFLVMYVGVRTKDSEAREEDLDDSGGGEDCDQEAPQGMRAFLNLRHGSLLGRSSRDLNRPIGSRLTQAQARAGSWGGRRAALARCTRRGRRRSAHRGGRARPGTGSGPGPGRARTGRRRRGRCLARRCSRRRRTADERSRSARA